MADDLSKPMPDTREVAAMWLGKRRAERMTDADLLRFEATAARVLNQAFDAKQPEDIGP